MNDGGGDDDDDDARVVGVQVYSFSKSKQPMYRLYGPQQDIHP